MARCENPSRSNGPNVKSHGAPNPTTVSTTAPLDRINLVIINDDSYFLKKDHKLICKFKIQTINDVLNSNSHYVFHRGDLSSNKILQVYLSKKLRKLLKKYPRRAKERADAETLKLKKITETAPIKSDFIDKINQN
ncbi:hypothetical protein NQ317_017062 [Molorchus minor]|uniref:Uncharacterized protein n=1 Tax=Molorchus minor TaxID=1323400 RepID=A0ABQ9K7D4_9CUCU|nr:hypothetical protein NQ317_017062 [Molorchus minor]